MQKTRIEKPILIVGAAYSDTSFFSRALEKYIDTITWEESK